MGEDQLFERLLSRASKVKFPKGIFGKTAQIALFVCAACGVVAWCGKGNPWILIAVLAALVFLVWYVSKRAFDFAEKNPAAAILEGSEFIQHEEMRLTTKRQHRISDAELDPQEFTAQLVLKEASEDSQIEPPREDATNQ